MSETPEKTKRYKNQVHLRLGDDLVKAIENRAKQEGVTTTALMIKITKQYLGWEEQSPQSTFNIDEIEKHLFQRLSEQWISYATELEEKIYKSVSERVAEFDFNEIENRVSERVLARISQQEDKQISECVSDLIHTQNKEILDEGSVSETTSNTKPTEDEGTGVSNTNTEIHTDQEASQDASAPEEHIIETTLTGAPLLFDSMGEGQVLKPSEVARYLQEIEQDSTWKLHKVRRLKNKQLTYLKKPTNKREGNPPLPMITGKYLIDWTPSEASENLDNTTSAGKSWWIQRLPSDPDEAEKLIAARRKHWNSLP